MTATEVAELVERELAAYTYPRGLATLGRPRTPERVQADLAAVRAGLVPPAPVMLTADRTGRRSAGWLVARAAQELVVFYDPEAQEFGLGEADANGDVHDINVRGDFVGTFCAA